jgi:ABC-type glycerol-3-phosphate transport system substrate-binding protein
MRRLALLSLVVGLAAAGCGGGSAGDQSAPPTTPPATAPADQAIGSDPTPEQIAARKQLLAEIAAGTYKCDCTAAARAHDRIQSGKAKPPDPDELVSALP